MSVQFDAKSHTYTKKGERYISVTTLLKKYTPLFDSKYWATYKAIKDVMTKKGSFQAFKNAANGWENVVGYYIRHGSIHQTAIHKRTAWYLSEWSKVSKDARKAGHKVHKQKELEIGENGIIRDGKVFNYSQGDLLTAQDFTSNGVYAELLLCNDEYQIAGQADKVEKEGPYLQIYDYKTSKEITTEPFRDEMLSPPLENFPNANYYLYTLQLSLYAWMLEQCGYEIEKLTLVHLERDSGAIIETYDVDYVKPHIETLLRHYRG